MKVIYEDISFQDVQSRIDKGDLPGIQSFEYAYTGGDSGYFTITFATNNSNEGIFKVGGDVYYYYSGSFHYTFNGPMNSIHFCNGTQYKYYIDREYRTPYQINQPSVSQLDGAYRYNDSTIPSLEQDMISYTKTAVNVNTPYLSQIQTLEIELGIQSRVYFAYKGISKSSKGLSSFVKNSIKDRGDLPLYTRHVSSTADRERYGGLNGYNNGLFSATLDSDLNQPNRENILQEGQSNTRISKSWHLRLLENEGIQATRKFSGAWLMQNITHSFLTRLVINLYNIKEGSDDPTSVPNIIANDHDMNYLPFYIYYTTVEDKVSNYKIAKRTQGFCTFSGNDRKNNLYVRHIAHVKTLQYRVEPLSSKPKYVKPLFKRGLKDQNVKTFIVLPFLTNQNYTGHIDSYKVRLGKLISDQSLTVQIQGSLNHLPFAETIIKMDGEGICIYPEGARPEEKLWYQRAYISNNPAYRAISPLRIPAKDISGGTWTSPINSLFREVKMTGPLIIDVKISNFEGNFTYRAHTNYVSFDKNKDLGIIGTEAIQK